MSMTPRSTDFLEEVHTLPNNNPITGFSSAQAILIIQCVNSGQECFNDSCRINRGSEVHVLKDLQVNMQTLNELVTYLTKEKQNSDEAIREILRSNHPAFGQLRSLLSVGYRVFFTTRAEFSQWLKVSKQYTRVETFAWDNPAYEEWIKTVPGKPSKLLKIWTGIFNEKGDLVIYTPQQWQSKWISLSDYEAYLRS